MTTFLVLTLLGDDKPGLVESVAELVARHEGNWLESSMSQLAGKFAGILRVSVEASAVDALVQDLEKLGGKLRILVERVGEAPAAESPQTVQLSLVGNDRPGIVREISHCLAELGVNVEQLTTGCAPAPMSGTDLFNASARLRVPAGLSLDHLQSRLERLADEMIVDIKLD